MSLIPKNWQDAGIFLLQHHDDRAEIDLRHMMVGARVGKGSAKEGEEELIPIAAQDGQGTVGDIHPWRYWAPESQEARPMGSWAQVFGAVIVGGSGGSRGPVTPSESGGFSPGDGVRPGIRQPGGGVQPPEGSAGSGAVMAQPIRFDDYAPDSRYKAVEHSMPPGQPEFPEGYLALAVAGTEEFSQENLLFPVDARLIDPNWSGPGSMGTIVADLEPTGVISTERIARLQSAWRVVRMPDNLEGLGKGPGYGLAWQLTSSQQDDLAGYGLCYGKPEGGGGGPAMESPTVTPSDNPNQGHGAVSGGGHWGIGAGGVGPGNVPGAGYMDSQQGAPGGVA